MKTEEQIILPQKDQCMQDDRKEFLKVNSNSYGKGEKRILHKKHSVLRELGSFLDVNANPEWPPIKRNSVVQRHDWQKAWYTHTKKSNLSRNETQNYGETSNAAVRKRQNVCCRVCDFLACSFCGICEKCVKQSAINSLTTSKRKKSGKPKNLDKYDDEYEGASTTTTIATTSTCAPEESLKEIWPNDISKEAFYEETALYMCGICELTERGRIKKHWLDRIATLCSGVELRRSTLGRAAGFGLFSTRMFLKNNIITEYVGWTIDRNEALYLRKLRKASHIVKLWSLQEYICGTTDPAPFIGGGSFANDGSPDLGGPGNNAKWHEFYDGRKGKHRIFLKATVDIYPNQEIFVAYNNSYWLDIREEDGVDKLPPHQTRLNKTWINPDHVKKPDKSQKTSLKRKKKTRKKRPPHQKVKRKFSRPKQNSRSKPTARDVKPRKIISFKSKDAVYPGPQAKIYESAPSEEKQCQVEFIWRDPSEKQDQHEDENNNQQLVNSETPLEQGNRETEEEMKIKEDTQ